MTEDIRSRRDLATMASRVATAVDADAIICATELVGLARRLADADPTRRLIVASHNAQTLEDLQDDGIDVVAVTTLVEDRYRQARVVTASVLASRALDDGDLVVCVVGHGTSLGGGDLIMVTALDETSQIMGVGDLVSLTDGVSPTVLESLLEVADRIGRVSQRGKRLGAMFVIGDSDRVQEGARQLVLNPLRGHDEKHRKITDPNLHDTLVELAKLDGAFVLRGDGLLLASGVFLTGGDEPVELPAGLGTRHVTAAAITARTAAAAVVVSSTDGDTRVFSGGRMVLHRRVDPVRPVWSGRQPPGG